MAWVEEIRRRWVVRQVSQTREEKLWSIWLQKAGLGKRLSKCQHRGGFRDLQRLTSTKRNAKNSGTSGRGNIGINRYQDLVSRWRGKEIYSPRSEHRIWEDTLCPLVTFELMLAWTGSLREGFILRNMSKKGWGWFGEAPMSPSGLCQKTWGQGEGFIWASPLQCVLQITEAFPCPTYGARERGWPCSQGIFSIEFLRRNPDLHCKWDPRNMTTVEACL